MITFWRIGNNYINPAHVVRIEILPAQPNSAYIPAQTESMRIYVNGPTSEGNNYVEVAGAQVKRLKGWLESGDCVYPADEPEDDGAEP